MRALLCICVFSSFPIAASGAAHTAPNQPEAEASISKSASQEHIVEIHKFKFDAKLLDVKVGDTVTWINKDIVPHTATALDKSWGSGRLKKGESFTLTITDATSLDYFCAYHRQIKAAFNLIDGD